MVSVVNNAQSCTACTKQQLKFKVSLHILIEYSAVCREHLANLRVQGQVFCMHYDYSYWSEAAKLSYVKHSYQSL